MNNDDLIKKSEISDEELVRKADALEALRYWRYIEGYDKISDIPPINIVRCKDCANADKFNHCSYVYWWNGPDDYCSKGKRKREHSLYVYLVRVGGYDGFDEFMGDTEYIFSTFEAAQKYVDAEIEKIKSEIHLLENEELDIDSGAQDGFYWSYIRVYDSEFDVYSNFKDFSIEKMELQ